MRAFPVVRVFDRHCPILVQEQGPLALYTIPSVRRILVRLGSKLTPDSTFSHLSTFVSRSLDTSRRHWNAAVSSTLMRVMALNQLTLSSSSLHELTRILESVTAHCSIQLWALDGWSHAPIMDDLLMMANVWLLLWCFCCTVV